MTLLESGAKLIRYDEPGNIREDVPYAEANGLLIECPKCINSEKSHSIIVPFQGWPASTLSVIWSASGSSLADLTIRPSVRVVRGCNAHFSITKGKFA